MRAYFRFILDQHILVNLVFLTLMAVGVACLYRLPVERYPNVHMGKVVITTILPGASPEEVEALVTREIEDAIEDMEQVEFVQSASYRERSSITVKFVDDADYKKLYADLRIRVLGVVQELPADAEPPSFTEINVKEWLPTVTVNLVGDRGNRALTLMAEELKIPLRQIPGVEKVEVQGEHQREYRVLLNPGKLDRFGLTYDEVAQALTAANVSVPAGDFADAGGEYVILVDERFRSREQIERVVVRRDADGSFVTVGEVLSEARMDYREPFSLASVNGRDAVALKVVKADHGNALDIVPAVEKLVERYRPELAREGVEVVLTQDQRIYIDDALSTLSSNLLTGLALIGGVIWLFMGLRNAIIANVGVPFAFLVALTVLYALGQSLNEISLFALVLVSGMLVDDAVVLVDNMYRHHQQGLPLREAVVVGAAEVAIPATTSSLTTMAAFLPMLMMTGSTGQFFAQIPIAVCVALAASIFDALVLLPSHFHRWPGARRVAAQAQDEGRLMEAVRRAFHVVASVVFRVPRLSLALAFLVFVSSVAMLGVSMSGMAPLIRIKFFPDDFNQFWVDLEGPLATPVEATHERLKVVSARLAAMGSGNVRAATAQAGLYVDDDYQPVFGSNYGHVIVELPARDDRKFTDPVAHLEFIRTELQGFNAGGWSVRVRPEKSGPPTGKDVNVRISGPNPTAVQELAAEVREFLRTDATLAPQLLNLADDQGQPNRTWRVAVDQRRTAEFGLTPARVAGLAGGILDGRTIGEFRAPDEDVDLKLAIDPAWLDTPDKALAVPAIQHASGPVRLADLATARTSLEPGKLNRYQNNRSVTVAADLRPDATVGAAGVAKALADHYAAIKGRFPGAELSFGGEFETTRRSYTSLAMAFGVSIIIIYLMLAIEFQSYLLPFIILSSVPFAFIGIVYGSFLTRSVFTVNSFIAALGVAGVVVNNTIVLIEFINEAHKNGMSRQEAMRKGVELRLRPVFMTTVTDVIGLLPTAIGFPAYSLTWGTMATTFVCGLAASTFLSLLLVPVQWNLLMAASEWWKARRVN